MRIVQSFLTVVFFAFLTQVSSASNLPSDIKPVATQIQSLLKGIEYDKFVNKETKFNISFFVNGQNEIMVVSTNNQNLDEILKNTLNYKKISMNDLEYNKIYTIPVVIK
jgi:phosphoribosylpyrophosphate synthetase